MLVSETFWVDYREARGYSDAAREKAPGNILRRALIILFKYI
jgi:hypothetical protein